MAKEIHHIVPNGHGGWSIRRDGEEKAFFNTDTKIKAIKIGIEISKNEDTLVVIHEKDQRLFRADGQPEIPFPFPFGYRGGNTNIESLTGKKRGSSEEASPDLLQGAYR